MNERARPGWRVVRWLSVVPAAMLGWLVALVAALLLHGLLDRLCPPEEMVSGMCTASWYRAASRAVLCSGAGLAGCLVVMLPALVAPAQRSTVAWVAFAGGLAFAMYALIRTAAYVEFVFAAAGGLAPAVAMRVLERRRVRASG